MTALYLGGEKNIIVAELQVGAGRKLSLSPLQQLDVGAMPSFLAFRNNSPFVLAISEGDDRVVSLRRGGDGLLEPVSAQNCPGGPCYVAFDASGSLALTASYGSGETRSYRLGSDGQLSVEQSMIATGKYTHCVVPAPSGSLAYVASKGTDSVLAVAVDVATGRLRLGQRFSFPAGSGPRHLVFNPEGDVAYVACENDSHLAACEVHDDNLRLLDHTPALARKPTAKDSGADVHLSSDGRFAYMSVRGEDCIAVFNVEGGAPRVLQRVDAGGRIPRNFCLLGEHLAVVANRGSSNLCVFARDAVSGKLRRLGEVTTSQPAYWVGSVDSH